MKVDVSTDKIIAPNFKRVRSRRPRATQRERQRMQMLNQAFDNLRIVVPRTHLADYQKLSKIATLRLAIQYIRAMKQTLGHCQSTSLPDHESDPVHYSNVDDPMVRYNSTNYQLANVGASVVYYQCMNGKNKNLPVMNCRDNGYLYDNHISNNGCDSIGSLYQEKYSNNSTK